MFPKPATSALAANDNRADSIVGPNIAKPYWLVCDSRSGDGSGDAAMRELLSSVTPGGIGETCASGGLMCCVAMSSPANEDPMRITDPTGRVCPPPVFAETEKSV